jgi:hypothetical protein
VCLSVIVNDYENRPRIVKPGLRQWALKCSTNFFPKWQYNLLKSSPCSQVVQQGVLTGLLVEEGILTKEEFLEMVRVMDREMRRRSRANKKGKVTIFC